MSDHWAQAVEAMERTYEADASLDGFGSVGRMLAAALAALNVEGM